MGAIILQPARLLRPASRAAEASRSRGSCRMLSWNDRPRSSARRLLLDGGRASRGVGVPCRGAGGAGRRLHEVVGQHAQAAGRPLELLVKLEAPPDVREE